MFTTIFHKTVDELELSGSEFEHLFNACSFILILKCNISLCTLFVFILFLWLVLKLKKSVN